jgi:hypothetical protein
MAVGFPDSIAVRQITFTNAFLEKHKMTRRPNKYVVKHFLAGESIADIAKAPCCAEFNVEDVIRWELTCLTHDNNRMRVLPDAIRELLPCEE